MENWLRMMQQWGIPMPEMTPPPMPPTSPYVMPDNSQASLMGLSGLPMPMMSETPVSAPAALEPPVEEPMAPMAPMAPGGFAPFQPPPQIAQGPEDLFGVFNQTLGQRTPPPQMPGAAGPMLRAQPQPMMGAGMGAGMGMGMPRKPPLQPVHPRLAAQYPQSARATQMFDQARRRKGWI